MTIREILLFVPTYPDTPTEQGLESAAFLAQALGARVTGLVSRLDSDTHRWSPSLGLWPVDVPGLVDEALRLSKRNAQKVTKSLTKVMALYRVPLTARPCSGGLFAASPLFTDLARLHDLSIIPAPRGDGFDQDFLQSALFDTGRPTLLLPSGRPARPLQSLGTVVVAWDFSREASRAMADALPILRLARKVKILSVLGEKTIDTAATSADLERYLKAHQVKFARESRTLKHEPIGNVIRSFCDEVRADMLVMGAYGHSRFHEFVLGGATRGMLFDLALPVFLSH